MNEEDILQWKFNYSVRAYEVRDIDDRVLAAVSEIQVRTTCTDILQLTWDYFVDKQICYNNSI